MTQRSGVIIGAGPAGLSAAQTLAGTDVSFTVLEADTVTGGISKTVEHNGFLFDLGGHRFFTKNREIDQYVTDLLGDERVMVDRSSKILLRGKFFDYPLKPANAMLGLGLASSLGILGSYLLQHCKSKKKEPASLEEWMIREFGTPLYKLFFKTYTEKVWGIPCGQISAAWGAQRIKGLSLRTAVLDAFWKKRVKDAASLVQHFGYPRKGIGVICDKLAETISAPNRLLFETPVTEVFHDRARITHVGYAGPDGGGSEETDFLISSMPLTDLVFALRPAPPDDVLMAARALQYRSLVCVALMFDVPFVTDQTWIYVHEPGILFGRLHEPKNWSRAMAPQNKSCVVFEYFCTQGDEIWNASDADLCALTASEFSRTGINDIAAGKVIDGRVVRTPKAYPSYRRGFSQPLTLIKSYVRQFSNLQLVGRYGTYKYNNLDHSIETGIKGAQNVLGAQHDTFMVNAEDSYLEEISD